jgi:hypothetical protein
MLTILTSIVTISTYSILVEHSLRADVQTNSYIFVFLGKNQRAKTRITLIVFNSETGNTHSATGFTNSLI